jgi:hypothetical protein
VAPLEAVECGVVRRQALKVAVLSVALGVVATAVVFFL